MKAYKGIYEDPYSKGFRDGLREAQKISKWVTKSTFVNNDYTCQNCGAHLGYVSNATNVDLFNFCYNCGAKMIGGDING